MSIKVAIQKKIIELVESGTFYKVTYEKPDTNIPVLGDPVTGDDLPKIWVNETSAKLDDSSASSSKDRQFNLMSWNFEARIMFREEVDCSEFFTKELSKLYIQEDGYLTTVEAGGYNVQHPVTGGKQTGTYILLNLTANTRR